MTHHETREIVRRLDAADGEHVAAQCAYAVALTRGDHPEVLKAAGAERVGDPVDKPA